MSAEGDSILYYLPAVEGLVFDGCTQLTTQFLDISSNLIPQFVFSDVPNLTTFSIQNCTGLTGDIDLTSCTEITEVDASGTSVNVLIP
jgi:hypothetical protein